MHRTSLTWFFALALLGCGDDDAPDLCPPGTICLDDGGTEVDAGFSTRRDTGPRVDTGPVDPCGDLGGMCSPDRGCPRSAFCQSEIRFSLESAQDPVTDLPDGEDTSVVYFPGGYCTPDDISNASRGICNPADPGDPTCGECGRCVNFGVDTMCLRRCEPSVNGLDVCREGYTCDLSLAACIFGCTSDAECRISREETNEVPGVQTPQDCELEAEFCDADCYCEDVYCGADDTDECACETLTGCTGDMMNFDRQVYDTSSMSTCNPETGRCEFPGTPGVQGGDPCTGNDEECEANGRCLSEEDFDWPGGTCTKFRCDLPGNECAGDGVCGERRVGTPLCLQGCTVPNGASAGDPSTWPSNRGGCREGYSCVWNGVDGAGVANNGHCVPGEFNEIAENNIGGPCGGEDPDSMCWSPFGQAFCFDEDDDGGGFIGGYCSVFDCLAPGIPPDVCGEGNICVDIDGSDGDMTACLLGCTTASECRPGYACADNDGDPSTPEGACLPSCTLDSECRGGETCMIPAGQRFGTCG